MWADNADYMSIQYSGTGALKTDFTRTGKRTRMGLVKDGINSMTRYWKNNFTDGFRQVTSEISSRQASKTVLTHICNHFSNLVQDSIDLLLGNYIVEESEGVTRPCPLEAPKGWRYLTVRVVKCLDVIL